MAKHNFGFDDKFIMGKGRGSFPAFKGFNESSLEGIKPQAQKKRRKSKR